MEYIFKLHSNLQKQQKEKVNSLKSQEFLEEEIQKHIFLERLKSQNIKILENRIFIQKYNAYLVDKV